MDTKRIRVDEMTPEESVRLLAARLPIEYMSSDVQPLRDLAARLMKWLLLLKFGRRCDSRIHRRRRYVRGSSKIR
jgi:hypothetical protein